MSIIIIIVTSSGEDNFRWRVGRDEAREKERRENNTCGGRESGRKCEEETKVDICVSSWYSDGYCSLCRMGPRGLSTSRVGCYPGLTASARKLSVAGGVGSWLQTITAIKSIARRKNSARPSFDALNYDWDEQMKVIV